MPTTSPESGALVYAAPLASGRRVCVLVDSAAVLLTQLDLPSRSGGRAPQIARFALEEHVLGDIEAQHVALGRLGSDGQPTTAAVAERSRVAEWLAQLAAANIRADLLCPVSALVPRNPTQSVALLDDDNLILLPQTALSGTFTAGSANAITMPVHDPLEALRIAFGETPLDSVELLVYAAPEDWNRYGAQIESLRSRLPSLHVQVLNNGLLPWLAPQLASTTPLNLLQGEFQSRQAAGSVWRQWRVAAMLLAALLLIHVGDRVYSLLSLQRAEKFIDTDLAALGERALPGVKVSPDALRRRVQQTLATTGTADASALLATMQGLSTALGSNNDARLRALSFRDGAVDAQMRARDAESMERVNRALKAAGLNAEFTGGNASASGFEGRILIKAGKS
jgi:general secretion pathway protein L